MSYQDLNQIEGNVSGNESGLEEKAMEVGGDIAVLNALGNRESARLSYYSQPKAVRNIIDENYPLVVGQLR